MGRFRGRRNENLALNHMTNIGILESQMREKLVSLVTGSPPLWVTRKRSHTDGSVKTFVNQAEILQADILARSHRGDQQIMHVINEVLEPLVPISLREAQYLVQLDAKKLLAQSTLYELSGHRLRVFKEQAELNEKIHMFGVPGQHTFFLPVDESFDVSVQLTGYDHERHQHRRPQNLGPVRAKTISKSNLSSPRWCNGQRAAV